MNTQGQGNPGKATHRAWSVLTRVLFISLLVLILDQGTKAWVRAHIPLDGAIYPIPAARTFFRLTHLTNTGVAFGFFSDTGILLAVIVLVILITSVIYARHLPWYNPWVQLAAGLQLGGALGNLIDRLRWGHVTDFLDFFLQVGGKVYHYPPFNVADASIVIGVAILFITLWRWGDVDEQDGRIPGNREHLPL